MVAVHNGPEPTVCRLDVSWGHHLASGVLSRLWRAEEPPAGRPACRSCLLNLHRKYLIKNERTDYVKTLELQTISMLTF